MAIVFPTSPSDGDTITVDNRSYVYSSSDGAWKHSGSSTGTELSSDSSPQLGGGLDTNGNDINFADNNKAIFGDGTDLQIYHDGTNSIIGDVAAGNLLLTTNGTAVKIVKGVSGTETLASFNEDSSVELYHDNSKKFETTSTGVLTTGTLNVNSAYSLPTADGTAGQVIKTDGSGTLSFTDALTSSAPADIYSASSDPTSNLSAGQLYYNSTDKYFKYYNGTEWLSLNDPSISVDTVDIFGDSSSVALWQLNGNANDAGGTYNLGGSTGSSNFTTGKFGNAFNGSGSNSLTSSTSGLNVSGDFSVSFWYKSNNTGQSNKRVLTVKGQNRTAGFNNYNNSLGFYHGAGQTSTGTAGSVTRVAEIPDASINDNSWHHLAFSITSGGTYAWYLDGSSYSGSVSGEGRSFNSGSFFAITTYDGGTGYNSICQVDQVRLFNRVITASEVTDLYNISA